MVQETRKEILQHLGQFFSGTEESLCRALRLTKADVHYHLGLLLAEGAIVREKDPDSKSSRGRPRFLYRKSAGKPNRMIDLLLRSLLMSQLKSELPDQAAEKAAQIARVLFPSAPSKTVPISLRDLLKTLGEFSYKPGWEAHQDGPHILFHQCPFVDFISDFPQLCALDAAILNQLTGRPVRLIWQQNPGTSFSVCAFTIEHLAYSAPLT